MDTQHIIICDGLIVAETPPNCDPLLSNFLSVLHRDSNFKIFIRFAEPILSCNSFSSSIHDHTKMKNIFEDHTGGNKVIVFEAKRVNFLPEVLPSNTLEQCVTLDGGIIHMVDFLASFHARMQKKKNNKKTRMCNFPVLCRQIPDNSFEAAQIL